MGITILNQLNHHKFRNFLIGVLLWLTLGSNQTLAAILKSWTFDPKTNQLEFTVESNTNPNLLVFENPTRIVLDLPNTALGTNNILQNYSGFVREIRVSQFQEEVTRIVIEFVPQITLSREQIKLEKVSFNPKENRWILSATITENPVSGDNLSPSTSQQRSTVTVPPLNSGNSPNREILVIEFGQPLPKK